MVGRESMIIQYDMMAPLWKLFSRLLYLEDKKSNTLRTSGRTEHTLRLFDTSPLAASTHSESHLSIQNVFFCLNFFFVGGNFFSKWKSPCDILNFMCVLNHHHN